jgi:hypothetical protein
MGPTTRSPVLIVALTALVGACSAGPRPVEQLARASTLIEQAEKTGAARFAAADLEQARGKLSQAQAAADDGNQETALRLAKEAAVEAELAQARSSAAEAKNAEEELERSLQTLREEAAREPGTGGADRP